MSEDKKPEQSEEVASKLKTPPPSEYTTQGNRVFVFGKPALKHRKTIMKVLKALREPAADYDAILKCAKDRGMELEDFLKLEESDYTVEEKRAILKDSSVDDNFKYAELMSDILTETLYATIKAAPFNFTTLEDFEEKMDDYGEAVELFPIAVKWVALSALDLKNIDRKNL